MKKYLGYSTYVTAVIMVLVLTAGCAQPQQSNKGLQISSMTSAIGAVDQDKIDQQRISFAISICNDSDQDTYLSFVEPLVAAGINGRIISGDTRIEVKKKIPAQGFIEVKGEFIFDAEELSKEDILNMEPIITGYRVGTEQQIEM